MPDEALHACAYHVLRYTANLVRDEWVNIGALIYDPSGRRAKARVMMEPSELARVRRVHPNADLDLLSALSVDFERQFEEHREDPFSFIAQLDQTLSNVLQLSPQKGVLTPDLDAELDRLYRDLVEPPRYRRVVVEALESRNRIRTRINGVFVNLRILEKMDKGVPVEEFTYPGDPLKLDYAYRRNGARGFIHALLLREAAQAKALAYTAKAIRAKLAAAEFAAVTETAPRSEERTHQFVSRLLEEQRIELVPAEKLEDFANRIKPTIH
jgi:hypothetical protein